MDEHKHCTRQQVPSVQVATAGLREVCASVSVRTCAPVCAGVPASWGMCVCVCVVCACLSQSEKARVYVQKRANSRVRVNVCFRVRVCAHVCVCVNLCVCVCVYVCVPSSSVRESVCVCIGPRVAHVFVHV